MGIDYQVGETFVATSTSWSGNSKSRLIADMPINNFDPVYEFNTSDLMSKENDNQQHVSAF